MGYFNLADQARMQLHLEQAKAYKQMLKSIKLIGHRGMGVTSNINSEVSTNGLIPENTISSFKEAIILGADGIELDVFSAKDGTVMVIHSDELRLHVYNDSNTLAIAQSGSLLPCGETEQSFIVGNKNYEELKQLIVGSKQETIPTLLEVLNLIQEANIIRTIHGAEPLILNIEFKNSKIINQAIMLAVARTLSTIQQHINNYPEGLLSFNHIYFCSFNHQALKYLINTANRLLIRDKLQFAVNVDAASLFGEHNIDSDYKPITTPIKYLDEELLNLKKLFTAEAEFIAYDIVVWNIYRPFIELVKARNKELHISAPNYRMETISQEFCIFLLKVSDKISQILFKSDAVNRSREVLHDKANKLQKYKMRRSLLENKQKSSTITETLEVQSNSSSDLNSQTLNSQTVLGSCLNKPDI